MAGVIKVRYGKHPDVKCLSQKLASSLGDEEQGPGPPSLGKKLARQSRPNPEGLDFKTIFCLFQRTDGKVENSDRKPS